MLQILNVSKIREKSNMIKIKKITAGVLAVLLFAATIVGVSSKLLSAHATSLESVTTESLQVNAKSALLMDYHTGSVVYEHNASSRFPIASMVKIMTLTLAFEEIEKGNLSLESDIVAGANATAMGGSQAFLDTGASYKAGELIKTIIVSSANDSCVALAEHISGSSEEFVMRMNEKAASLGATDTNFANCTGLPSPNGYSCAKDVALMTQELLRHENFFKYATVWMFDMQHPGGRVTELSNTNKLIRAYEGCDGGKTGFTNEAMYCLSATAKRGNTRLISVVIGSPTSKERNAENAKLFNYGFANYETRQLVKLGEVVGDPVAVAQGKEEFVNLLTDAELYHFSKKGKKELTLEAVSATLKAPVAQNQVAGEVVVKLDGEEVGRINLVTEKEIAQKTYFDFLNDAIKAW